MKTVTLEIPERYFQAISLTVFRAEGHSVEATVCAALLEDGDIISINEDGTFEVLDIHDHSEKLPSEILEVDNEKP